VGYGAPALSNAPASIGFEKKLKILYVGRISQTKGISYLSDAVDRMTDKIQLTIVGMPVDCNCANIRSFLGKHKWHPSMPHSDLLQFIRLHDVLVLPSLCEGFGLVILEAMSQGVPVIATSNSGAPDFIQNSVNGWVIPIRSVDAITEILDSLFLDRSYLRRVGFAAWVTAGFHNWLHYRNQMWTLLSKCLRSTPD
jgi:glycosyltransferase involved in cell wall biosynthesis